jgi:acetate kinase
LIRASSYAEVSLNKYTFHKSPMSLIVTLNAGSSSLKYSVYRQNNEEPNELIVGQVENLGAAARLSMVTANHNNDDIMVEIGAADHALAVKAILKALRPYLREEKVIGIGHRYWSPGGPRWC